MSNNAALDLELQLRVSTEIHSAVVRTDIPDQFGCTEPGAAGRLSPPLLYLAFEGVLHAESYGFGGARKRYVEQAEGEGLFEHAKLLSDILQPFPHVRIVLSTSWVSEFGFGVSLRQLPRTLQDRVVGCTNAAVSLFPGQQVAADVLHRKPHAWLALEADLFGWPEWCLPNVVVCDTELGIARPDVRADFDARLAEMGRGSR